MEHMIWYHFTKYLKIRNNEWTNSDYNNPAALLDSR